MKKQAAWRDYAEQKDLDRLARIKAKIDRMDSKIEPVRSEYRTEFERVKNYSTQRMRRAKDAPK